MEILSPPQAGPLDLGAVVIGAGAYTDILYISAPHAAEYGDTVNISVNIKNISTSSFYVGITGRYDGVDIVFSPDYALVKAGASYIFTKSFSMPNKSIKLEVWCFYWTGSEWVQDDYEYTNIFLSYAGKISRKELEYDETRASIPASNIPQNKRGLVHIWGRNDMATSQKLGISWVVRDPDDITVEAYSDWQSGSTSPGSTHEFIGGRFTLNKAGIYKIYVGLFMNPDNPGAVDTYSGTLCSVVAAVPSPEFSGFGIVDYSKR